MLGDETEHQPWPGGACELAQNWGASATPLFRLIAIDQSTGLQFIALLFESEFGMEFRHGHKSPRRHSPD